MNNQEELILNTQTKSETKGTEFYENMKEAYDEYLKYPDIWGIAQNDGRVDRWIKVTKAECFAGFMNSHAIIDIISTMNLEFKKHPNNSINVFWVNQPYNPIYNFYSKKHELMEITDVKTDQEFHTYCCEKN
jgi:hypothetical protein